MNLVLLFFCVFLVLVILILFSSIRLKIKIKYMNNDKQNKITSVYLEFYLLGLVKIARKKISNKMLEKFNISNKFKSIKQDVKMVNSTKEMKVINKLKLKVKKFDLKLDIGTENAVITAYATAIISSLIRNIFKKFST